MANTPKFEHLNTIVITMDVTEGNITITTDVIQDKAGGTGTSYSWASQVAQNYHLIMNTDFLCAIASAGEQEILGWADSNPRWMGNGPDPWIGDMVTSGTAFATTAYRSVSIGLLGQFIREVPVGAGGTATEIPGFAKPHASVAHTWEKDATGNGTMVIKLAAAGSNTVVMFGRVLF